MAVSAEEKEKFVTFMRERIHKDFEKYAADLEQVNGSIKEYSDLSALINKLTTYKSDHLEAMVDMGCNMFMQGSIQKWDTIIVKMDNEYFAELPLERAKKFVEEKLKLLRQRADRLIEVFNSIRAHDRLMASLINELDVDLQS
uniref:Prefoldin subunit 3 n=1 Tax=Steinernema glaseri TaxID=37863 RepID=A0A1I7YDM0_9BILA